MLNRDQIDAKIFENLKFRFSPQYKVINCRTRWIGQRDGRKFFSVRYFMTSLRFIGGVRYDKYEVFGKEARVLEDES